MPNACLNVCIRAMSPDDYDDVYALWQGTAGIGLSDADSEENITQFLARNPDLSLVARDDGRLVGAVLCGHDGRRGYLHHLAVEPSHRGMGIGRALVERCLSGLADQGIQKCHIFVYSDNAEAIAFWTRIGWRERVELAMLSRYTADS